MRLGAECQAVERGNRGPYRRQRGNLVSRSDQAIADNCSRCGAPHGRGTVGSHLFARCACVARHCSHGVAVVHRWRLHRRSHGRHCYGHRGESHSLPHKTRACGDQQNEANEATHRAHLAGSACQSKDRRT